MPTLQDDCDGNRATASASESVGKWKLLFTVWGEWWWSYRRNSLQSWGPSMELPFEQPIVLLQCTFKRIKKKKKKKGSSAYSGHGSSLTSNGYHTSALSGIGWSRYRRVMPAQYSGDSCFFLTTCCLWWEHRSRICKSDLGSIHRNHLCAEDLLILLSPHFT